MLKIAGIFEDKLIMDCFIGILKLSFADMNDVFICNSRDEGTEFLENNFCDILFTDNSFSLNSQTKFFSDALKMNCDVKIIILGNEFEMQQVRSLFKMGADDCVLIKDLQYEYIDDMLINFDSCVDNKFEKIRLREEILRKFFWGEAKYYDTINQNYRINPDSIYIAAIRILVDDRKPVSHISRFLTEYLAAKGKGEGFFNHFSQIVILFSPDDEVDVTYFKNEVNNISNLLSEKFDLKLFSIVGTSAQSVMEHHLTWLDFYGYTDCFFVCDKSLLTIDEAKKEYVNTCDYSELLPKFKDTLENLDLQMFITEIKKLADIKPAFEQIKELIDFVKQLHNEIYEIDDKYNIGAVNYEEFNLLLNSYGLKHLIQYFIRCVTAISENISDINRVSAQIKNYLEKHLAENITLSDIADEFNFEYNYSSKYFCKVMGMPFKKYLNDLRIVTSLNMLKHTNYKCYEIAMMCGYKNYEHFSRVFYSKYGKWPREVKKNIFFS